MKINILMALLCIQSTFSCNESKVEYPRKNEITKIVFATGGCYGKCPVQVFSIDSNLAVKYQGIEFTENRGFYVGKVDKKLFDSLNIKFEGINYKQLDAVYKGTVDDLSTELYIYYDNKVKKIVSQYNDLPDSVQVLYDWLLELKKEFNLKKTNDSLTFETITDGGFPPILKTIQFKPPTIINN